MTPDEAIREEVAAFAEILLLAYQPLLVLIDSDMATPKLRERVTEISHFMSKHGIRGATFHRYAWDRLDAALLDLDVLLTELRDTPGYQHLRIRRKNLATSGARRTLEEVSGLKGDPLDLPLVLHALHASSRRFIAYARQVKSRPQFLRHLVPDQKVSPVQFDVRDGRVVIAPQPGVAHAEDRANIDAAREQLLANGTRILKELERSNCDPRLVALVKDLHAQLESNQNIVQLGIMNIGCEVMCAGFEAELPTALFSMLHAQTMGVSMYVGQFPDWARFAENAALAEMEQSDTAGIAATANKLVAALRSKPDVADPEVPATIAKLSALLSDPAKAPKRVAFAVLRTIENFISGVFSYAADFLDQTIKKTTDKLSGAIAKTVVVALLTAGVGSALELTPVAARIKEIAWIKRAAEVVQKQIDEIAKGAD